MPSKNMLPKGQRHRSVRAEYVKTRGVEEAVAAPVPTVALDPYAAGADAETHTIVTPTEAKGMRLDQYLAQAIPEISRSRVQLLIENGQVLINGVAPKAKHKMSAGEVITIEGSPRPAPLKATAEDIALDIVFEDAWMAVIDKPAGMSVHAGNAAPAALVEGDTDEQDAEGEVRDPRSSGTLVNALMHHFAGKLSTVGGELRPGIVHRLDKQTSGLILVAKDDPTHRMLAEGFADRTIKKMYVALVQGHLRRDETTVTLPIGRDLIRRTRMTTRRPLEAQGVRSAISHVHVAERIHSEFGPFTLVEVRIETGRTHQIRVHLQALGHPVVGDTVYGAAATLRSGEKRLELRRNFLHAARLELSHSKTGEAMVFESRLPTELQEFLRAVGARTTTAGENR